LQQHGLTVIGVTRQAREKDIKDTLQQHGLNIIGATRQAREKTLKMPCNNMD
jgi:hypothetical protein